MTGAFMVIGCLYGMTEASDTAVKEKAYAAVRELTENFCALHGSISCRQLLGCDLNTEEGRKDFTRKNLASVKCSVFVRDAARLVEEVALKPEPTI